METPNSTTPTVATPVAAKPVLTTVPGKTMRTATVRIRLSKDADVVKHHVTPIEALLLTSEHHRNVGGSPIVLDSITNEKVVDRKVDDEFDRLKTIYHAAKVDALMTKVREMPETFKDAVERGIKLVLPSGQKLSETKLV